MSSMSNHAFTGSASQGSSPPCSELRKPYLLFVGNVTDALTAKTAFGIRDWCAEDVLGQWRLTPLAVDLGLPDMDPVAALAAGVRSVVIGSAPVGGVLDSAWIDKLAEAARLGLDIVAGLHTRLNDIPELRMAAALGGSSLRDLRVPPMSLPIGTGKKRSGKRLLTVGTDCAIGKKYTALAIAKELQRRGVDASFRATGQTGIMIAGSGIPIDSVVADFVAGAAELLSPAAAGDHWDVIEGQGSLFHPSYAGVALGLIHGSQPDVIVVCFDPDRTEIDGCPDFPVPPVRIAIERNLEAARLTNDSVQCAGISLRTSRQSESKARDLLKRYSEEYRLPCIDPVRFGAGPVVDTLL